MQKFKKPFQAYTIHRVKSQAYCALAGNVAVFSLLLVRILCTGEMKYLFLIWNIFLAWVGWGFGIAFLLMTGKNYASWMKHVVLAGWVTFLPNTFYLLTDMVHPVLNYDKIPGFQGSNFGAVPDGTMILFDIGLVGLAVWVGWYLGVVSLLDMRSYFASRLSKFTLNVLTQIVIMLSSFAIYLGRTPRLNTWDILVRPAYVVQTAVTPFLHPVRESDALAITLLFTTLISTVVWSHIVVMSSRSSE